MNYIILIICSVVLPIISLKQIKPNLCINCKYFIPDDNSSKFSKCFLCPTDQGKLNFLVNGIINMEDYYYCSIARNGNAMCGENGKHYKKKRIKNERLKDEN